MMFLRGGTDCIPAGRGGIVWKAIFFVKSCYARRRTSTGDTGPQHRCPARDETRHGVSVYVRASPRARRRRGPRGVAPGELLGVRAAFPLLPPGIPLPRLSPPGRGRIIPLGGAVHLRLPIRTGDIRRSPLAEPEAVRGPHQRVLHFSPDGTGHEGGSALPGPAAESEIGPGTPLAPVLPRRSFRKPPPQRPPPL